MLIFLLFCYSVFRYFDISVFRTAEGIQKCEHDHDYEHIWQSSALSVVRELSSDQGNQTSSNQSFPPILLLLQYTGATESPILIIFRLLTLAPVLPPRNIGTAHHTAPHWLSEKLIQLPTKQRSLKGIPLHLVLDLLWIRVEDYV